MSRESNPHPHPVAASSRLLPLGALAAGFGLLALPAFGQTTTPPAASAAASQPQSTLAPIPVRARVETDATSLRATTTTIGKGVQDLRDVPQSVTVITERLIEDRRIDTLKQALHQTAGITFQAAEGGEEDIRLRGFSLAASGDIYVDSLRDPAFYERDTFSFDRIELLRGSASMLFGRGSTGGVVNQVSKMPFLANANELNVSLGNASYQRVTGDFNIKTGDTAALRVGVMETGATNDGNRIDKQGLAPTLRWGIGTDDEFYASAYVLRNKNGINYGIPWLRKVAASNAESGLLSTIDPRNYYGAQSDYNNGGATLGTFGHTHRFADGGMLKSAIRQGRYDRDQRASTVRFFTNTNPAAGPLVATPGLDTVNANTPLTLGTNNKVQDMVTTYAQSDYSNSWKLYGMQHDVLTGIDLAHEVFQNYALALPPGVTLDKNTPRVTLGQPGSSPSVDESARLRRRSGWFDAKALGIYAQDMVQLTPTWKVLGGLRWDYFKGDYRTYSTAASAAVPVIGTTTADRGRADPLWSKRFGLLYQPNDATSFHFSYGTSFNTSGDTYQYDDQTKNTPPESSENLELGAKIDALQGALSTRLAVFRSTKKNERNRDPDSAAQFALLSGKRHTAGVEVDIAGRLMTGWEVFLSYAWTPIAKIDIGAPGTTPGVAEGAGTRSSMTPRNSGSLWTTYQATSALRFGGGLNVRSAQTPNRNPAGIAAPAFVTGDLMAEYTVSDALAFKFNVINVSNKLYADSLYTAHYIPGAPRSYQLTTTFRF